MFVVTLPLSAAKDPKTFALRAKSAGADVLEIRGDLTPDVAAFDSPLPLLISPRHTGPILMKNLKPSFIDLELDEGMEIPKGVTVIRSFHDHEKTPPLIDLLKIAERLDSGDIVKLATFVHSYDDVRTLMELHARLKRKHVVLGMGPKAHLLRMLSPLQNILSYTFIDDGDQAAPGQVPLSLYKMTAHCQQPKLFGILGGAQVSKSLSPIIQNTLFQRHGFDALYSVFPTDDLQQAWTTLTAMGVEGFSVTSPFKESIIPLLDELEPEAKTIGSVNTVIRKESRWVGANTDVIGLQKGFDWNGAQSVVILGSGGVVPAIIRCCQSKGIDDITVLSRNTEERSRFGVREGPLEDIATAKADVMVCAITDDIDLPLPETSNGRAFDLRYGNPTKFLTATAAHGWHTADGLSMLIHQALEQFRLFTGVTSTPEDRIAIEELFPIAAGNGRVR